MLIKALKMKDGRAWTQMSFKEQKEKTVCDYLRTREELGDERYLLFVAEMEAKIEEGILACHEGSAGTIVFLAALGLACVKEAVEAARKKEVVTIEKEKKHASDQ